MSIVHKLMVVVIAFIYPLWEKRAETKLRKTKQNKTKIKKLTEIKRIYSGDDLLNDPFYIGLRHKRVRGKDYDTLLENFMKACTKKYGQKTLIQFEDFANPNAFRLLDAFQDRYTMFNDDIQGTAAVIVAGLLTCARVTKKLVSQEKYLFFGAGAASTGIAEMVVHQMQNEGISKEEACNRIYLMDIDGLVTKSRKEMNPRHVKFAKDMPETSSLVENAHCVVRAARPGALIGASTVRGAFNEEVIRTMAEFNEHPIIFALSNPTSKAECTAEEAYKFTNGTALYASGSPFPNVELNGHIYKPGQGNNAYIFPGVALGTILFQIRHIDTDLFLIAAKASRKVAACVTEESLKVGRVYPQLKEIREISIQIAVEMARYCYKNGTANLYPQPEDLEKYVRAQVYSTEYDELINATYEWPQEDMKHGFPVPIVRRDSMDG
ncbi:NAD-dependent malic enzyme, mitochondrial [Toxocara canis]|uniref:Malic enzyme n=1 Tax=Toxocara canis TaxID=6265 RepID=A0A0B2W419_TOXCA|nr:NAD-dependent malic enzyme, mitochondrial [Toxocara canis]